MKITKTIATTALALATVAAMAQGDPQRIRVVIDGERVHFGSQPPTESDGRVLVPLRGVFEKLGATVDWDPATQTITAYKPGVRVKLAIGNLDASVNGDSTRMDIAATLDEGVTMVPLRFVSEALGAFVNWDAADHEVDIKSTTDYNLPRPQIPPPVQAPPPVQVPPPPQIVIVSPPPVPPVAEVRPLKIVHNYREISADTVIPLTLDTRLSSRDSKPGDPFSATLDTKGGHQYSGLPAGTQVYGTVTYVKRQHHRDPGIVEVHFDHLMLPNGRSLPVNGRLIGMDDASVMHGDDGRFVAKSSQRNNMTVFVANGTDSSLVLALPTERPLRDSEMGSLLTSAFEANQRPRLAREADIHAGTHFGLRLYEGLILPSAEDQ